MILVKPKYKKKILCTICFDISLLLNEYSYFSSIFAVTKGVAFHLNSSFFVLPFYFVSLLLFLITFSKAIALQTFYFPKKRKRGTTIEGRRVITIERPKRLRAITLQGALEKSSILLLQYWKNEQIVSTTKNYFAV